MPLSQTIIDGALIELEVYAPGDTPETIHRDWGLLVLNRLMGKWNLDRRNLYATTIFEGAFTTSAQSYTIGPAGASFTAARPIEVLAANLVRVAATPDQRVPLRLLSALEYAAIETPALSAEEPVALYYNPTPTSGTLFPWPYPVDTATAKANKLELVFRTKFSAFADLASTNVAMPDGLEDALTLTLAERLSHSFGKQITPELAAAARDARAAYQSINSAPPRINARGCGLPGNSD